MFYIFLLLYLCACIYYYKIIIFNIVVKYNKQLVDVSAIEVLHYYCYCCCYYLFALKVGFCCGFDRAQYK